MNEIIYYIALNSIFGYDIPLANLLLDSVDGIDEIWRLSFARLNSILRNKQQYVSQITPTVLKEAQQYYDFLCSKGYKAIIRPNLPVSLHEIPDAPLVLYVNSKDDPQELFSYQHAVAVIGTRDFTLYGKSKCEEIVRRIAEVCPSCTIVSGLAIGCDYTAHKTALDCGIATIAAMGTGLEKIYPARHGNLAERIASAERSGLITDFNPYSQTHPVSFLRRNRLIAALCDATIVIESSYKGGSMSTARYAFDYNKDVWALPGRVGDEHSGGCNGLIEKEIAHIITDIDNLPYNMGLVPKPSSQKRKAVNLKELVFARFSSSQFKNQLFEIVKILEYVRANDDVRVEDVSVGLDLPITLVGTLVAFLESEGLVERDLFGTIK